MVSAVGSVKRYMHANYSFQLLLLFKILIKRINFLSIYSIIAICVLLILVE